MTVRNALVFALLCTPFALAAQETEQKSLSDLTIETLGEMAGGVQNIGPLELSSAVKRRGAPMMCATTNTYNSNGFMTGLTYWQVTFSEDGSEVKSMKDVTGLNHECYGSDLKRHKD